jgi:predicted transcriptional regulator
MNYIELAKETHLAKCIKLSAEKPDISETKSKFRNYGWGTLVRLLDGKGRPVAIYQLNEGHKASDPPTVCRVYNDSEIENMKEILLEAESLWYERVMEFKSSGKNPGTCVCCAGIQVYHLSKGSRRPYQKDIIEAPDFLQGSLSWEASKDEILRFLCDRGVDCSYNRGHMD